MGVFCTHVAASSLRICPAMFPFAELLHSIYGAADILTGTTWLTSSLASKTVEVY